MNKKHLNALKNKAAKQQRAIDQLIAARLEGRVVELIADGNRFVRDAISGKHLVDPNKRFVLTESELDQLKEVAQREQEEWESSLRERREMKELLACAILYEMRFR